jgi:heptosyltransferase-2
MKLGWQNGQVPIIGASQAPRMTSRPLIVRLRNWVGDVILGVPALLLLERHGYALHLVGRPWAGALLGGHGWDVHVRPPKLGERLRQLRALKAQCLRADAGFARRENALSLPHSFSAALDLRLAGLKAVGYAQEARSFLLARAEPITYGGHALVSYWELACRFLRVSEPPPREIGLKVAPAKQQQAQALLAAHDVAPGFVVLCPFAGGGFEKLDKTWPRFAEFARAAARELGRPLVIYPGPGEGEAALRDFPDVAVLQGADLGVYAALLQRAALVVSNDTGPAHIAAAVGTAVLSVLGPTKPEQWAPWGPEVHIEQRYPQWPEVDAVLERARRLLASRAA